MRGDVVKIMILGVTVTVHFIGIPNTNPVLSAMIGQKVPVETIVRDVEKKPCPPVPVLGHVMWNMRKDDAGEASHETTFPKVRRESIECTVTVIEYIRSHILVTK